jgi:hypothetical protein
MNDSIHLPKTLTLNHEDASLLMISFNCLSSNYSLAKTESLVNKSFSVDDYLDTMYDFRTALENRNLPVYSISSSFLRLIIKKIESLRSSISSQDLLRSFDLNLCFAECLSYLDIIALRRKEL